MRRISHTYDLSFLEFANYDFQVIIDNYILMSKRYGFKGKNPKITPSPKLAYPRLSESPLVCIKSFPKDIIYPQKNYEIIIQNYGSPALVKTSKYLTNHISRISPAFLNLNKGESGRFNMTIDWKKLKGMKTFESHNAFYIEAPQYGNIIKFYSNILQE